MSEKMPSHNQMKPTAIDAGGAQLQKKLEAQRASQQAESEALMEQADQDKRLAYQQGVMEQYGAKTPEEALQKMQEEMKIQVEVKQQMALSRERKKQQAALEDAQKQKLLREAISLGDYEQQGSMDEILEKVDKIQGSRYEKPPVDLPEQVYGQFLASRGQQEGLAQGAKQEREIEAHQQNIEAETRLANRKMYMGSEKPSKVSISQEVSDQETFRREEAGGIGDLTLAELMSREQEEQQPSSDSIR